MEICDILMKDASRVIDPQTPIMNAMSMLQTSSVSCLIVPPVDRSDTYGLITIRDIVFKGIARGLNPTDTPVSHVMVKPVLILNNLHLEVKYAAKAMANADVDKVLNFDGEVLVGKLSIYDVMLACWKEGMRKDMDDKLGDLSGGC
jgi:CBS domain-containing protein